MLILVNIQYVDTECRLALCRSALWTYPDFWPVSWTLNRWEICFAERINACFSVLLSLNIPFFCCLIFYFFLVCFRHVLCCHFASVIRPDSWSIIKAWENTMLSWWAAFSLQTWLVIGWNKGSGKEVAVVYVCWSRWNTTFFEDCPFCRLWSTIW